jgi:2-oxoisovalerate dehydrogenase E1 component
LEFFAQSVSARIRRIADFIDAPVRTIRSVDMPAVPLNEVLEKEMILSVDRVGEAVNALLNY